LNLSNNAILQATVIQVSFDKLVTKQHHSLCFQNIKNPKYTFCREFNSE